MTDVPRKCTLAREVGPVAMKAFAGIQEHLMQIRSIMDTNHAALDQAIKVIERQIQNLKEGK